MTRKIRKINVESAEVKDKIVEKLLSDGYTIEQLKGSIVIPIDQTLSVEFTGLIK